MCLYGGFHFIVINISEESPFLRINRVQYASPPMGACGWSSNFSILHACNVGPKIIVKILNKTQFSINIIDLSV
jgi:hypothetical protein